MSDSSFILRALFVASLALSVGAALIGLAR